MSEQQAVAKIEKAPLQGFITPAMKSWATELCLQDETSFDDFVASTVPQFAHLTKPSHTAGPIPPFYPLPTAQVEPYVNMLGTATAIEFLLNFGGAELIFTSDPKGRGMVERLVGYEDTVKLAKASHRLQKRVPLATRWLAQCLYAQGLSKAAIARRLRITDVTVAKYLKGHNSRISGARLRVLND